jgi:hypothetical protein
MRVFGDDDRGCWLIAIVVEIGWAATLGEIDAVLQLDLLIKRVTMSALYVSGASIARESNERTMTVELTVAESPIVREARAADCLSAPLRSRNY